MTTREAELIGKLRLIAKDCHWQLLEDAADTIDELMRDAARYRWLKAHIAVAEKKRVYSDAYNVLRYEVETDLILDKKHQYALDNDIDAAIKESK